MTDVTSGSGKPITMAAMPAVVAGNANDFYAFYVGMDGSAWLTYWANGSWNAGRASSGGSPPNPGVLTPAPLQACVGQSNVYCVYPSSSNSGTPGLQALYGTGSSLANTAPQYAYTGTLNSFCPYADDGLSLVVNAQSGSANTLTLATLSGGQWSSQALDKASLGVSVPVPLATTPIASILFGVDRHILFEGRRADGQTTVYDLILGTNKYYSSRMLALSSSAMGLAYFTYNGFLFSVVTSTEGHIHVMYYNMQGPGDPQWAIVTALTTTGPGNVGAPLAKTPPAVVSVNGAVFVNYTDTGGNVQCAFFVPFQWNCVQVTGAGGLAPSAPAPTTALAATQFGQMSVHVCYVSLPYPPNAAVTDLFFVYPQWYTQTLYPGTPSAGDAHPMMA